MGPFIELLIFLVLCILMMGMQGILVFIVVCGGYFGILYLLSRSALRKRRPPK